MVVTLHCHGCHIALSWWSHCNVMVVTLHCHGCHITLTWLSHCHDKVVTWSWHGCHMVLAWLSRGHDMVIIFPCHVSHCNHDVIFNCSWLCVLSCHGCHVMLVKQLCHDCRILTIRLPTCHECCVVCHGRAAVSQDKL